jgi:two-component system sensor histidine kinase HydH
MAPQGRPKYFMKQDNQKTQYPPRSTKSSRFPRAISVLLFATVVLVIILFYSTLQNINRAQSLMEIFLQDKGETIIRSVEAGSRTTMHHHMGGGDPLNTLLTEYAKDQDISFMSITDAKGKVLRHIGDENNFILTEEDLAKIFTTDGLITKLNREAGVFYLAKIFEIDHGNMPMMMNFKQLSPHPSTQPQERILFIGLLTRQFDLARQQDVRHAIFMGAILFLVGSAGLYFLFLYQKMRITSSNLANMKLYTDNIIESIPVAIITLDADDTIVSCNRNTEELFGMELSAIQGNNIQDTLPNCTAPISATCNSSFEAEVECTNSKGKRIPLRTSCSPLLNNEDENIGKVLIIRDMSSIKEMEIQLERSRRMAALGKMAAGIAHEIRNPLGTLRGFAQFFGNQPETSEDGKNYSKLMISEIDRLNQTISGLLQFSRPREPQLDTIEVDQLFNKTVSMMAADFKDKNIDLQRQKDTGIRIKADPDLLLQVLMNLLKNCVNAISSGGTISLSCQEEEYSTLITISDNGCGMSEEVRQKMFDPFFTTIRSGTGLGLAVSHQIIEQHNGSFEVHTKPDNGTSISVRLPK